MIGSYIGWVIPNLLNISSDFFTKLFFSIIFGIIGVFLSYKFYKFLAKKI